MPWAHLGPLTWLAGAWKTETILGLATTLLFPPASGDIQENKESKQRIR